MYLLNIICVSFAYIINILEASLSLSYFFFLSFLAVKHVACEYMVLIKILKKWEMVWED